MHIEEVVEYWLLRIEGVLYRGLKWQKEAFREEFLSYLQSLERWRERAAEAEDQWKMWKANSNSEKCRADLLQGYLLTLESAMSLITARAYHHIPWGEGLPSLHDMDALLDEVRQHIR